MLLNHSNRDEGDKRDDTFNLEHSLLNYPLYPLHPCAYMVCRVRNQKRF
jgi:hypothetical protein